MRKVFRAYVRASAVALVGLGAVAYATSASAACDDSARFQSTSWQDAQRMRLLQLADLENQGVHSIVGMWSFKMTVGSQTADFGYQQWHSDGTELMNSGGRAPASENFCMGVWRQTGPARYHLNHLALSYDPSTGTINARVNIKEDVVLDPTGSSYSGTFSIDVYDPSGTTKVAPTTSGQVTAQRVRAN